jgi:cytochrome b561
MSVTTIADKAGRPDQYSSVSKWIHWIIALCVIVALPMGIALDKLPEGPLQDRLFDLHRSLGILVLALAIVRVAARQTFGTPAPASSLTTFERIASTAAHHSLLALIFLQPIVGWLSMDAYRADVSVFGLFTLPHVLPQSDAAYKFLSRVHAVLGFLMAFILAAHIGGALMHGVIKRDGVLNRMLPETWGRALDRMLGRSA